MYRKLEKYGVLERCHRLDARIATREELLWLHTPDYIDELSATAKKKQSTLNRLERQYDSIFFCPETYQAALLSAGSSLQVVESIVDWDIHHGNGIQKMFEEDPRVLYISLHRLDLFPFNPEQSDCNVVGKGLGTGFTVNIAWPTVKSIVLIQLSSIFQIFHCFYYFYYSLERCGRLRVSSRLIEFSLSYEV